MQQVAQGLASLGRGNDTQLVHMTPGEVAAMQQLATAHGGSLTINPQTGLPEAGFLSSILPMVAGIGLAAFGIPPIVSSLLVGGGTAAMTGSLGKGLMAGFGAFGGAGLGEGLGALGAGIGSLAPEAAAAGAAAATPFEAATLTAGDISGVSNIASNAPATALSPAGQTVNVLKTAADSAYADPSGGAGFFNDPSGNAASAGAPSWTSGYDLPNGAPPPGAATGAATGPAGVAPANVNTATGINAAGRADMYKNLSAEQRLGAMGKGVGQLTTGQGWSDLSKIMGGPGKTAMAFAPLGMAALSAFNKNPTLANNVNKPVSTIRPYSYSPGTPNPLFGQPGQPYYLGQSFTAQPTYTAAEGGMIPDTGSMYPTSQISKSSYGTATQVPTAFDVVGDYDQRVDPMTGEPKLAGGGLAGKSYTDEPTPFDDDAGRDPIAEQMAGMSASKLEDFANEADDARVQAAALHEIRSRAPRYRTPKSAYAKMAMGGLAPTEYAAGGKLLRGPGDGMSDSIPAVIKGDKPQRAALAQGEFVVPADVVSHLGNGSTDAGAKRLYAMMDKVRLARTGNKKQGKQINPDRFMFA
jgi:hypothetical protein